MTTRYALIAARLFFALLTLTAILVQFSIHLGLKLDAVNFFSYFTNLSNIFASIMFIIGASYLIQRREPTLRDDVIRGASVVSMAIVGIVFSVLLRNEDLGALLPWVNAIVHYIMPVVVVADWLIAPPAHTLTYRQVGYWLIFPLLYLIYTLIRGAIVGFYPYPFLNPAKVGGYGVVALYCLAIFAVFLVFGALLVFLANLRRYASAK